MAHPCFARALMLCAAVLAAPQARAASAEDWKGCRSDKPSVAIPACTKLIERGANDSATDRAEMLRRRGWAYRATGRLNDAIADLNLSIDLDPSNADAFNFRGFTIQFDTSEPARSVADYNRAISLNPKHLDALTNLASAYEELGEPEKAIEQYGKIIEIDPKNINALFMRGKIYEKEDDFIRAITDYSIIVSLKDKEPISYLIRGEAFLKNSSPDSAIADFGRAIDLDPMFFQAYLDRAQAHKAKDDLDSAILDYDRALTIGPYSSEALHGRGAAYHEKGDVDRAIADFDRSIELAPKNGASLKARGDAYVSKGKFSEALADYDRAIALAPSDVDNIRKARDEALSRMAAAPAASLPSASVEVKEKERADGPATISALPKRLALVVGNGAYANVPTLKNPAADARAIADKLRAKGFAVTLALDAGRSKMLETVGGFLRSIEKDAEVLVYYAGHGVEFDGANYIVPVDMPAFSADAEELIKDNSVNLNSLLVEIGRKRSGAAVVILDACRDNPFRNVQVAGLSRSIGGKDGLAPVAAPRGVFVLYSAGVNQKALDRLGDDDTNPNGLFTRKLLPLMDEKGLELRSMATRLRREVSAAARTVTATEREGHDQSPASYDQMDGDFFFTPAN